MHGDREPWIPAAAMALPGRALPNLGHAIDVRHYDQVHHDQVDDVISEPWVRRDGAFELPTGPRLRVELDRDEVDYFHRHCLDNVAVTESCDPYRPGCVAALTVF